MTKQKKNILHSPLIVTALLAWLLLPAPLHADVKTESLHFLTTEAGAGYSALLHSSPISNSSGLAGAKLQLGYEWRYRKLLVHTGLEFASLNDRANVPPFTLQTYYTQGLPEGQYMTEYFDFQSFQETQSLGQLNIPVQVGGIFADRYYFLAGARIGLQVLRMTNTSSQVRTWLVDPSLIGELGNVPVHDAFTSNETAKRTWPGLINAQVSAELGVVLNSFFDKPQKAKGKGRPQSTRKKDTKKPILYRVGVFADYGLNSCVSGVPNPGTAAAAASVEQPRGITFNSTLPASASPVNSLLVGVKFAVLFQLNQPKPAKPLPSYFDIWIADAQTKQPVPVSLKIYDHQKKRPTVKEAKKGHLKYRAKEGDYTITASNEQYYPDTMEVAMHGDGITDTLRFALTPKPQPVVIDTPIIAIPVKVGTKVVLHNLFFATNKTQILPQSEQALDELAAFMTSHPALSIRITGHTDAIGSEKANQILSEGRANAVRDELLKRGIAAERIEAEGKGETEPVADNATEEGRAKNRRVEFTITATGDEDIEQIKEF